MRVFKKLLCVGFIVAALVVSFSLSASAKEPVDFQLSSFPMHQVVNDGWHTFENGFYETAENQYYYFEFICVRNTSSSTIFDSWASPCIQCFYNSGNYYLMPCFYKVTDHYPSFDMYFYVYDVNGDLVNIVSSTVQYVDNTSSLVGVFCSPFPKSIFGLGSVPSAYDLKIHNFQLYVLTRPQFPSKEFAVSTNVLYSLDANNYVTTVDLEKTILLDNEFFEGNIKVNGAYVIGGDSPIQPGAVIHGEGSLTPVYDDNGNITNYNIINEFDLGLNDSDVPGAWDPDNYPDKEAELLDDLPGIQDSDIDSINDNLSSDSLNSNAVQWWYGRFSDVTSNNKFRSVMLTMLSLSVIAFVINKRGVL